MRIALKDIPAEGLQLDILPSLEGLGEVLAELSSDAGSGAAVGEAPGEEGPSLTGSMQVLPIGGSSGYYVHGHLEGRLVMACARCLGPASVAINEPFQFQLFPRGNVDSASVGEGAPKPPASPSDKPVYRGKGKAKKQREGDEGVELDSASLDVSFFDGDSVALEELLREQLLLSLDDTSLCSQDCKGLCQGCGAELNTEACTCDKDVVDPRFAVLKGLKLPQ